MKNTIKEQKGSMAVYVTIVLLAFMLILSAIYMSAVATRKAQLGTILKVKESYEDNYVDAEDMYEKQLDKIAKKYTITYENIINNNYPTEIIEGEELNITFINDIPDGVLITGASTYTYNNNNLIISNVTNNIRISNATLFEYDEDYVFDGTNYIDTGVCLFSKENYDKNFEVTFTIKSQNSAQEQYATLFNAMNESDQFFRGVVFRVDYYTKIYDFISDDEGANGSLDHINYEYEFGKVSQVKIYRIDKIIYISVNDGEMTKVRDYTDFNAYFDIPVLFGASLDSTGNPFRYYKGTLSNIKIKVLANDNIQEFNV